jgi:hypothetical protein
MGVFKMGYLTCDNCKSYYELQPGEKPKDFDLKCECGSILKFSRNIDFIDPNKYKSNEESRGNKVEGYKNKSNNKFYKDIKYVKNFILEINSSINPFAISVGLLFSVIVLIVSSFIFGVLMITGLFGIIIYAILSLVCMTLIGGFITGFIGCQDTKEGSINGGFMTLILLIGVGLLIGLVMFIYIGVIASTLHALTSLGSTSGISTHSTTSDTNFLSSIGNIILNIIYAIIAVVFSFIGGIGGGSLGVIVKKRLEIPL